MLDLDEFFEVAAGVGIAGGVIAAAIFIPINIVNNVQANNIMEENAPKLVEHIVNDIYSQDEMVVRNKSNDILAINYVDFGDAVDIYGTVNNKDNELDGKAFRTSYNIDSNNFDLYDSDKMQQFFTDILDASPCYVSLQDLTATNFEMQSAEDVNKFSSSLCAINYKESRESQFKDGAMLPIFADTKLTTDENGDRYVVSQLSSIACNVEKEGGGILSLLAFEYTYEQTDGDVWMSLINSQIADDIFSTEHVTKKFCKQVISKKIDANVSLEDAKSELFTAIKEGNTENLNFNNIEVRSFWGEALQTKLSKVEIEMGE